MATCFFAGEGNCDIESVLYHLKPNIHVDSTDAFLVGAPERLVLDTADPSMSISQVCSTILHHTFSGGYRVQTSTPLPLLEAEYHDNSRLQGVTRTFVLIVRNVACYRP